MMQKPGPIIRFILRLEPGEYQILIGASSTDLQLRKNFRLKCSNDYCLGRFSTNSEIFQNKEAVKLCRDFFGSHYKEREVDEKLIYFAANPAKELLDTFFSSMELKDEDRRRCEEEFYYRLGRLEVRS